MRSRTPALLVVVLAGSLAACQSGVHLNSDSDRAEKGALGTRTNPAGLAQISGDPLNDPSGPLANRSVYFGFDEFTVPPEYKALLAAHAQYLKAHPERYVLIEGNADERGSTEYNLALGQKRSEAVSKDMSMLGVPAAQVESVSFGKERPVAIGHDEASWARNRRADIEYRQGSAQE
ncbi:peptidoglycan-associated lipoprotein [Paraburkholderia fungorum]|uniref:Peptidoglycan-associated lipoprotein n=1 Tax=Paraburkholderia fungorum TaxID=134537 RepID=A0AAP5V101_9BURK|nr:peptidoglycan-associated lipoprotein Pal [Paraburkholderia fungorum]AJZ56564.1 peptidoglycan-associated lipoprotein [Paraburkholderia fungorum]MDT8843447.1 peptidoglycan-associated lipoprotein Pal [Paraburkholderia fungorum]PRZ45549.1 peptidoglycan-associated lipoprotein [Paraburkholderia fungorum]